MADGDQGQQQQQQQNGQGQGGEQQQQNQQQQKPWYDGKLDAELIGHAQNVGWKLDDPAALAIDALKGHREARKYIGVPEDQLLRLPKDMGDEAGWKNVWNRLGVPKDAKDYDLSSVKFADGTALDDGFAEKIRQVAFSRNVPKDAATAFAQEVVKFMEDAEKSELAEKTAALATEKTALRDSWKQNFDTNMFVAQQARKALQQAMGVDDKTMAEAIQNMESGVGYAATMKLFHTIGTKIGEDRFISGGQGADQNRAMSREQAVARHKELLGDPAWRDRYLKGGAQEKREMDAINRVITGVFEAA